jgi:hypothetical protein
MVEAGLFDEVVHLELGVVVGGGVGLVGLVGVHIVSFVILGLVRHRPVGRGCFRLWIYGFSELGIIVRHDFRCLVFISDPVADPATAGPGR